MAVPSLLIDGTTMRVLHRLYTVLDGACRQSADMSLATYAVLAEVAYVPEGVALRTLKSAYDFSDGASGFPRQLEERELAVYARSAQDRRALALRATAKGEERAALVDGVLAARIVEAYSGLTEESFDQLVELCYAHAASAGAQQLALGIIPAPCLRQLVQFEHQAVVVASRFGMTALQVVLLAEACAGRLGAAQKMWADDGPAGVCVASASLDVLRDRGLVSEGEVQEGTELGIQRLAGFSQRLAEILAPSWSQTPDRERAALGKLLQYVLYLFS